MKVQIEAQGIQQVSSVLESMVARGVRLRPLMGRIGVALIGSVHENFAQQGRPGWKPLSAKTIRSYEVAAVQQVKQTKRYKNAKRAGTRTKYENEAMAKVGGNKILQRSGLLRQSIMLGHVTDTSIEIGSSLPYARIHQLGGKIKSVTISPKNKQALLIPTASGYVIRRTSVTIPERNIPARPYLAVQPTDVKLIAGLTMQYIQGNP